ncbi:Transient receptor potential channel pyrexia [Diplonema papillatum]|nr:Transient receptor potential channel pyrexia [Diplonema papillatum]
MSVQLDLHQSARLGDVVSLQLILASRGASVNVLERNTNATALHYAVREQQMEAVHVLLGFRADPNLSDKDGRTPLHNAVTKQGDVATSLALVKLLLAHGGDPAVKTNDGEVLLHTAAREGHTDLVKYLLDDRTELDIDCRTERDETPLFFASANTHTNLVLELIERGANPNIPNMKGRTPLHMALRWAKNDVKKAIEKAASMAPTIEHVTLPSGLVIRKDLLPESFDEVVTKLRHQRDIDIDSRSPSPSRRGSDIPTPLKPAEHIASFQAQVQLLGGRDPEAARLRHLTASPPLLSADTESLRGGRADGVPRRRDSLASRASSAFEFRLPSEGVTTESFVAESTRPSHVERAQRQANADLRKKELDRLVDKERVRVDQRLRGLFYAGIQRHKAEHRIKVDPLDAGDPKATQKEVELAQLTSEIRALKEAGFRDPAKEMRRLARETRRQARAERKAKRDQQREEEEVDPQAEHSEVVGDHSLQLLNAEVAGVVPTKGAFTLRRIAEDEAPEKTGLFGIINALELRLKSVAGLYSDLDKRCDQLNGMHDVLKSEYHSSARRKSFGDTKENSMMHLSRKDQRIIAELEGRLNNLERKAKRDIRRKRRDEIKAGSTSVLAWWVIRLAILASIACYFWLESAVADFNPPSVWW